MTGQKPRQIAARVLGQRRPGGEFTENLLDRALAEARLGGPDRGLCHEPVLGVVRWQATLDWLIARKTPGRQQKAPLQDLLRLGLYQIFWLDRIPAHAAVNETVEQAKRGGFGPQAGFLNAMLRGYLRETDETRKLLADLKSTQPAIGWSHPEWLVERWTKQFGQEATLRLLEWNNTPAKTFARVNTIRTDAGKLVERWREENVEYDFFTREWTGENLVFELKAYPPLSTLGSFRDGWFYIQDPSTLLAARELEPHPGETVFDLCAAPGGKSTFIAQLMNDQGHIFARDADATRLRLLHENCSRLGVKCVQISESTVTPTEAHFDKVLVDAPCSNTGVLRRRVDARWRLTPAEMERLRATQLQLLTQAARAVRPGGVLVYSTCSLEAEENTELVRQFLAEASGLALERERVLTPQTDHVDGAFIARLRRG